MQSSLYHLFDYLELPDINIVDIGASPIDCTHPYPTLIDLERANVIGF